MRFKHIMIVGEDTGSNKDHVQLFGFPAVKEINSHKAVAHFLSKSDSLTLYRTKLDMQTS